MRGMDDVEATEFEDFICTCDEDSRTTAAAIRADVIARLAAESDEHVARVVDASNLLSTIVLSLEWDFHARITQIAVDQWFGVWAESYDGRFKTQIQGDWVEDGLVATWRAFAERPTPRKFRSG